MAEIEQSRNAASTANEQKKAITARLRWGLSNNEEQNPVSNIFRDANSQRAQEIEQYLNIRRNAEKSEKALKKKLIEEEKKNASFKVVVDKGALIIV